MGAPQHQSKILDIRTHLAFVFNHHRRYHDLRSSKTSCVDGKRFFDA
jgi:hypothetical protein